MAQNSNTENLRTELKALAEAIEETLHSSTDNAELEKLRSTAENALNDTRLRLSQAGVQLTQHTKQIAVQADDYVRTNPWASVGIGAAVGVVLGILMTRR